MVLTSVERRLTSVLALAAVLAFSFLPPEHIHARAHDGHHSNLVHRHFEPHHPGMHGTAVHADEDQDVQWMTISFTGPESAGGVAIDHHAVEYGQPILRPEPTLEGMALALFVSAPDPPWTTFSALRGPPVSRL